MRILGIDPGFANVGLCIVEFLPVGGSEILVTQVVTTSPTKGKAGSIDDEIRRLKEIESVIGGLLEEHKPAAVVIEEPGKCLMRRFDKFARKQIWATNPATLRTSCMMWGSVHGMSTAHGIPCIKVGAKDIKQEVCGKKNASKAEVIEAVQKMYPSYTGWPKTKKVEHVADAVGAVITGAKTDTLVALLKEHRTPKKKRRKAKKA